MNIFKKIRELVNDRRRSFRERLFLLLTFTAIGGCLVALIGDIILQDNIVEIIMLVVTATVVPIASFLCIRFKKIPIGTLLIVMGLVFGIVPVIFIFGGGVEGGCLPWIIFSYLYIAILMSGAWKIVMLAILSLMSIGLYALEYFYPAVIVAHDTPTHYVDSAISLIVVGVVIYIMVLFQNRLNEEENKRASEETKRAEELNLAQNRFFSSMSHEIRTPINSILGSNELILRNSDANEEIKRDANNIQGSGRMLLSLINDILDFSKIEAGSMDIVEVDYNVGDMLTEVVNMIWVRANENGLNFEADIDPKVPSVLFGDEIRIKQIIINLLNNAVKYTKEGSVTLHVESESVGTDKVRLIVSVTDTGIGIRQEVLPHIFDPFKRSDNEKNRSIEGTGLGLSIVKQLVEIMGGNISVNTVYGQGSTFVVKLEQGVSDRKALGNVNITGSVQSNKFNHLFVAPDANLLIVDDNKVNLEVEKLLLKDTLINIDTVLSGMEALKKTLEKKYDVILMDHLMPEMDGIECLENIRMQAGGLNNNVPVIVLTANAGSKERELYNAAGFDAYLSKPVSGRQLEETLIKFISDEKLILKESSQMNSSPMSTSRAYVRKQNVAIASSSLIDIPDYVIKKTGINILPHLIITDEGVFKDNIEISADETVRYMESGREAGSVPPEVIDYELFFSRILKNAHHVIYIAITSSMSKDYERACEAAKSFENVSVINSELLSSCMGVLALAGYKLSQLNMSAEKIIEELEIMKKHMNTSFFMGDIEYMSRKGYFSKRMSRIAKSLEFHPAVKFKNNSYKIHGVWLGNQRHCWGGYLKKMLPKSNKYSQEFLFVTYGMIPEEDLSWIEGQIRKRTKFDKIIFQQASATIISNSGPGTFGLLFLDKDTRTYNITSLMEEDTNLYYFEEEAIEEVKEILKEETKEIDAIDEAIVEKVKEKYKDVQGLDFKKAIKNSGSEDAFETVLKIFYDSIEDKQKEIDGFYNDEDWKNYTIKVHALKSSAKLIGAMKLSAAAQLLENAGKEDDIEFIRKYHQPLMDDCKVYYESLSKVFKEDERPKPEADETLMNSFYESIAAAAADMDCESLENIFIEMADYTIPAGEEELYEKLKEAADKLDYDTVANLLSDRLS
ncbi:MAG: DegV family EDD domain-containing protein [Lachnospiraceae bacterium]|nr:DegV family EDD domain-containing protein [Lachnospiraceae bacterium]